MRYRVNTDSDADDCGTFYAAKILGVAVATVQGLVERGELEAWKTKGGHRRISMRSLHAYIDKHGTKGTKKPTTSSSKLNILIVDDDDVTLEVLRSSFALWGLNIECKFMKSAIDAILEIKNINPDLLITDLDMPVIDGLELLRRLRDNQEYANMAILVMTGLSEQQIEDRGGIPENTPVIHKPLDTKWIHGFISAIAHSKSLRRNAPIL